VIKDKLARIRALLADSVPSNPAPRLAPRPMIPAAAGGCMDDVTRQAYLRRVRFLRDRYGLRWLVEEASGYVTCLDDLSDAELIALQGQLDRASQCIRDGVPLEDAGFVPRAWGDADDLSNHVSQAQPDAAEIPNHVSQPFGIARPVIPWHKQPENEF